jgi:CheY-like chemotaxis protein
MRVLIIDDDADIRDIAAIALEKIAQWGTNCAESGKKGLEIAKTSDFDVILLDISMPEMDGLEVYSYLQADPRTAQIPVIFLTAKVLPREQKPWLESGVTGVILKPFNPMSLSDQIVSILTARGAKSSHKHSHLAE